MIQFTLDDAIRILSKTPQLLRQFLSDLPSIWLHSDEGYETFSPYEVLGHLIVGEKTDWIPRMKNILEEGGKKPFASFDRFAHQEIYKKVPLADMLDEFEKERTKNLEYLISVNPSYRQLEMTGIHPELGKVTLRNLLSTWVTHDMAHLAQIARLIAKQYKEETGDFHLFMNILHDRDASSENDYDWSRFVLRIPIKGTAEELYGAFVTPAALESWFLREATFLKKSNGKPRDPDERIMKGDQYTFRWHGWPDSVMENGIVLEQTGSRLRFTFTGNCVVTVKLLKLPQTYLVELMQENIPTDDASKVRFHYQGAAGWLFFLTNLKSIMEGGIDLRNRDLAVGGVINM